MALKYLEIEITTSRCNNQSLKWRIRYYRQTIMLKSIWSSMVVRTVFLGLELLLQAV